MKDTVVIDGINELLSKEKPQLPQYIEDTLKTCAVIGMMFNSLKLGEIANNVVLQIVRMDKMFDIQPELDKEEIQEIAKHFITLIQQKAKEVPSDGK